MDGYKIDFAAATTAYDQIEVIIEGLNIQIIEIGKVQDELLDDSNWKCPNKTAWSKGFADYREKLNALLENAETHRAALAGMLSEYANAEQ